MAASPSLSTTNVTNDPEVERSFSSFDNAEKAPDSSVPPFPQQQVHQLADFLKQHPPAPSAAASNLSTDLAGTPPPTASTRSTTVIARANHLAQTKSYTLQYEYQQISANPIQWLGKLKVEGADEEFVLDQPYASKKEVRAALAALGVKGRWTEEGGRGSQGGGPAIASPGRAPDAEKTVNWMGKLIEYTNTIPPGARDIEWAEYVLGERSFAATLTLHPSLAAAPFGSPSKPHPNKKAARVAASRAAVQHLIARGLLAADGSRLKPDPAQATPPVPPARQPLMGNGGAELSTAAQVAEAALGLGLGNVSYNVTLSQPAAGAAANPKLVHGTIFDCEAYLSSSASVGGFVTGGQMGPLGELVTAGRPLGSIRSVFGKKNAKDGCAREVLEVLKTEGEFRRRQARLASGREGDVSMS